MSEKSPRRQVRFSALSRRSLLRGLFALAGAAGAGLALKGREPRQEADAPSPKYLFFTPGEALLMEKVGEAVLPTQRPFPSMAKAMVVRRADEELSFLGASIQEDLRAALWVTQWAPLAWGHAKRYTKLDLESRRDVLVRMMNSRSETLQAVGTNLKVLVQFFYFGHPSAWSALGYEGPFSRLAPIESEQRVWYALQTGENR